MSQLANVGLLIVRLGLGGMYIVVHGVPKILGGPELWGQVGLAMGNFGITAAPVFWGFLAAGSEFFGGICLFLGVFFRPACLFILATMIVAATMHLIKGDGILVASHAIENAVVLLGLLLTGPGEYHLGKKR